MGVLGSSITGAAAEARRRMVGVESWDVIIAVYGPTGRMHSQQHTYTHVFPFHSYLGFWGLWGYGLDGWMGGGRRRRGVFVLLLVAAIGRHRGNESKTEREGERARGKRFAEQRCGGVCGSLRRKASCKATPRGALAAETRTGRKKEREREKERRGAGSAR